MWKKTYRVVVCLTMFKIMKQQPFELRRRLYIIYKGEEGLDYGGVARSVPLLHLISMVNGNNSGGLQGLCYEQGAVIELLLCIVDVCVLGHLGLL